MALKGKGSRQVRKKCVKDTAYPCKFACILKTKNCRNPLKDQAKTFVEWMELQEKRIAVANKKRLERGRSAAKLNESGRIVAEKPPRQVQQKPIKTSVQQAKVVSSKNNNTKSLDKKTTNKVDPQKIEQDFDTVLKEVQALYKTEEGQRQISIGGAIDRLAWLQTAVKSGKPDLIANAIPEAIKKLGGNGTAIEQKLINASLPYAKLQYDKLPSEVKVALAKDQLTDVYGNYSQSRYDLYALNTPTHKAIADDLLTYIKNDVKPTEQKKEKNKSLAISRSGKTMHLQKNAKSKSVTENNPTKIKKPSIRRGYSREEQATLKTAHQRNLYGIAMGLDYRIDESIEKEKDILVANKNRKVSSPKYLENQLMKVDRLKKAGLSDAEANGVAAWISPFYSDMNRVIYDQSHPFPSFGIAAGERAAMGLRKLPSFNYSDVVNEGKAKGAGSRTLLGDGLTSRHIRIPEENMDAFLKPYRDSLGSEFKEPSFLATSIYKSTEYEINSNIQYRVTTKKDGQGVAVDKYKNLTFEGEVLFPPYSRFKISKIEEITGFDLAIEKFPSRYKGLEKNELDRKIKEDLPLIMRASDLAHELQRTIILNADLSNDKLAQDGKKIKDQLDSMGFPHDFLVNIDHIINRNSKKIAMTVIHMEEL